VEDGVDASRRSLLRHALRSLGRAGVLIRVAVGKPPFCQPFDLWAEEEGRVQTATSRTGTWVDVRRPAAVFS
jgi:hypothetical protein